MKCKIGLKIFLVPGYDIQSTGGTKGKGITFSPSCPFRRVIVQSYLSYRNIAGEGAQSGGKKTCQSVQVF